MSKDLPISYNGVVVGTGIMNDDNTVTVKLHGHETFGKLVLDKLSANNISIDGLDFEKGNPDEEDAG